MNADCSLDSTIYNPARILKLYGTIACKGDHTQERPHRESKVWLPEPVERIAFDDLEGAILSRVPAPAPTVSTPTPPETPAQSTSSNGKSIKLRDYLARHNIAWTGEKSTPDGLVFYLTCPFDSNHTGTDAFVIERLDGKYGFKCQHNSCKDYHWSDFRDKMGIATQTTSPPSAGSGENVIDATGLNVFKIIKQVSGKWRDDQTLFSKGVLIVQPRETMSTEIVSEEAFHLWITERFDFIRLVRNKLTDETEAKPVIPVPSWLLRALMSDFAHRLPPLDVIYPHPIVLPDGSIVSKSGYYSDVKAIIRSAELSTDTMTLRDAKQLILDELLGDFLFKSESDKANYLAYLLTFPMRTAIDGYIPLLAVDAPAQGAGKTLLLDLASMVWTGQQAIAVQVGTDDRSEREEMRKRLTALLMESPESIVFDNVVRAFNNASVASALTTGRYKDRLLGASMNIEVDIRTIMACTGNNLTFEGDMPRRVYWCRLTVDREKPETRSGFRHPRLLSWCGDNRLQLMHACLTLIKHWQEQDSPLSKQVWGSFEEWTQTIGGILEACGIEGFLDNQHETEAEDLIAMREFCEAIHAARADDPFTVADIFEIASHDDANEDDPGILDRWLGNGSSHSRKIRLGTLLNRNDQRFFGKYRLKKLHKNRLNQLQYKIVVLHSVHSHENNTMHTMQILDFLSPKSDGASVNDIKDALSLSDNDVRLGIEELHQEGKIAPTADGCRWEATPYTEDDTPF